MVLPTILTSNTAQIASNGAAQFAGGEAGSCALVTVDNGCTAGHSCATLPVNLTFTSPISMTSGNNNFNLTLSIISGGNTNVQNLLDGQVGYKIMGETESGAKTAGDYSGTSVFSVDYN